jgi:hypothetical protein
MADPGDLFLNSITSQDSDVGHASGNHTYSTVIKVVLIQLAELLRYIFDGISFLHVRVITVQAWVPIAQDICRLLDLSISWCIHPGLWLWERVPR